MPSAKPLMSIVAEGKAVADDLKDGRLDDKGGLVRFLKSLAACCGKADAVEPAVAAVAVAAEKAVKVSDSVVCAVKVVGDVIEDISGVATSLGVDADVAKKMVEAVAAVEKVAEEASQAVQAVAESAEAVEAVADSQSATPHSAEPSPQSESPDTPPQNTTVEEPSPEPSVPAPLESRPPSESETEAASNPTHPSEANTTPDSPQNRTESESQLDLADADRARMEEVD